MEHRIAEQKERQRREEEKRLRLQQKEQLSTAIANIGFWTSADMVQMGLASLASSSARVAALKTQLKFRQLVLC